MGTDKINKMELLYINTNIALDLYLIFLGYAHLNLPKIEQLEDNTVE